MLILKRTGVLVVILVYSFLSLDYCSGQNADTNGLVSSVRIVNGQPTLWVNGRQKSLILAAPYQQGPRDFNTFRAGGIEIFNFYLRFPWTGPEEWDFSRPDAKLDEYLSIDPDALFLPRILLPPGSWFGEMYPDEITRKDDGTPAGMFGRGPHPSFSSEVYRKLSHKLMVAFITHLEEKYGKNIVGYQVGNGFGGEWLPFNSFWETRGNQPPPTKFGVEDYSPASIKHFRVWLKEKYQNVEALRRAWGDPEVTFETAEAPNEVARYSPSKGIFFDPAVSSQVPDFLQFFNDALVDVLLENAAWIKEITNRKKIVGSFYGALWLNFPNLSANHSGQLGLTRVLNSKDIDFICSPYTYDNKQLGGPHNAQSLPEAVQLHGKLYFSETDTMLHVLKRQWRWGDSLHNPENWKESKALMLRDFGYVFTKGIGMWWTDLFGRNFNDPQVVEFMKKLKEIDDANLEMDKQSTADIAVILDEASFTFCGDGEPLFNALLTAQKQWELGFMGMPWEPHLLSDMDNDNLKDFKLYIFLNTFKVSPQQRAAIHARLKRNGATALWVYAPGYIDQSCDVKNISALTGINLAEDMSSGELHVDVTNLDHPITQGLPKDLAYGTDERVEEIIRYYDHQIYLKDPRDPGLQRDLPGFSISPRFYAEDPEATVLGTLAAGIDKPGLVVKKQNGWTSIYSAAPIVPSALLRGIARQAGVHIYSEADDVVCANKNFLSLYAPKAGTRTIHLPQRATVIDVLTGDVVAEEVTEFPLELPEHTSVLYQLKPVKDVFQSRYAPTTFPLNPDPETSFWQEAPSITLDKHIITGESMPHLSAEIRSRWTDEHLYFLFVGKYQSLYTKPDPNQDEETFRLWMWDCFEAYVDNIDNPPHQYRELQMSPQAEWLDLAIDSTVDRPGWSDERYWDSGMKVKSKIDTNKKRWIGAMQIPWSAFMSRPPQVGDTLASNFYRLDGQGRPARSVDSSGRTFVAWQPTGYWNPHIPGTFGTLILIDR